MTGDPVGGVWTYAMELCQALPARGFRAVLATMGAPLSSAQRIEAAEVPDLRVCESVFKLEWMQEPWADVDAAAEWLLDLEQEVQADVIHLNGYAHGALPWRAPALIVGHSCVLSWWRAVKGEEAPSEWDEYRRRVRAGVHAVDCVVAPTRAMLSALEDHYGSLPNPVVVENGRDENLFQPLAKEPFVLAAGRLNDESKNLGVLARASAGLPWPIYAAGVYPSGDDAAVRRLGRLPPAELAAWMGRAAIYCLPALYEPFGLSILEAADCECALVIGDIPSLRELWDGVALFVPPWDAGALRESLLSLMNDPVRRQTLGRAARERARRWTPRRTTDAYSELYHRLIVESVSIPSS